jgi:hypothetical protein
VVLAIALIAGVAFMMGREGPMNAHVVAGEMEAAQALYVAQAGLAHADWLAQSSSCAGDLTLSATSIGAHSYAASVDSPVTSTASAVITPDRDTWISEASPDTSFGSDSELLVKNTASDSFRALYHFDISTATAGSRVASATAWFYVTQNDPLGAVEIHPVTTAWTEGNATWNTVATSFENQTVGVISQQPSANVWVSVNLTALAQAWVNDGSANHGIMLMATSSDVESKYTSRQYTPSLRPYLEITTAVGDVSPVTISSTSTLASGVSRTLTRDLVNMHQPPTTLTLQPGPAEVKDNWTAGGKPLWNYGAHDVLHVQENAGQRGMIEFHLVGLPVGAYVRSASLELYAETASVGGAVTVHPINRSWVEGTCQGSGCTADGATYDTYDGINLWATSGGDFDSVAAATQTLAGNATWYGWDITTLARQWLDGTRPNHGLMLIAEPPADAAFASSDAADPTTRPRLTITYTCECGNPCLASRSSGQVALVVGDDVNLTEGDAYKQALFESWGYTVALLDDDDDQATFDSAMATTDVAYISETVVATTLADKLVATTKGVVNQQGDQNPWLGMSSDRVWTVGQSIDVTDNSHYITALFPIGALPIYDAPMDGLIAIGSLATDLQTLANWGTDPSLAVVDKGGLLYDGTSTAPGRRVMLPLGREGAANFNWTHLNMNGHLMVQRALEWGTGISTGGGLRVLYVVNDPASLSTQEAARRTLMQGWGFAVSLIDDDDTQGNFDAATASNDVVYVSQEAIASMLGSKLKDVVIGVVNENKDLIDDFGFTTGASLGGGMPTLNVDPSHYITSVFGSGPVSPYGVNEWYQVADEPVAAGVDPVGTWVEAPYTDKPALMALSQGADLIGGGTAPGRRVQIPMGAGQGATPVDINGLTDDGRTIIKRSIEWAGGAGCGVSMKVLLVVSDSANPSTQETARQALLESWCYTVTRIDDGATQAEYDAAVAAADVVYVSAEVDAGQVGTKLKAKTIGVVNEDPGLHTVFGFSTARYQDTTNAPLNTDDAHYITSPFGGGAVTLFTSDQPCGAAVGTLPSGLEKIGTWSSGPLSSLGGFVTLEAGAVISGGGTAAGRRVQMPWDGVDGVSVADIGALTADGRTILKRAIEWASAPPPVPLLLVVADASNPIASELARQALIESMGFRVTLISDEASQADYDTALADVDVVYTCGSGSSAEVGTKLTAATIGVLTEDIGLSDELGIAAPAYTKKDSQSINIIDNTHYVTSGFGLGTLVLYSYVPEIWTVGGSLAPGLQILGETQDAVSSFPPGLAVLETGAALYGGGFAAGRRVQVPWAQGSFDIDALTDDGRTIMKRALEWGAGAGPGGGGGGTEGVVFEEFAEVNAGETTNIDLPTPGGTAEGDLLIAAIASDGDASDLAATADWNLIAVQNNSTRVTLGVWWKIAGVSEPATHLFSSSALEMKYGWMMRFTGHDPSNPINGTSTFDTGMSTSPPAPSATTTVDNTLVLRVGGFDHEDIIVDDPGLPGHTPITMDLGGSGLYACAGGAGYTYLTTAGETGTADFALTGKEDYVTGTIAIAPAP